MRDHCIDVYFRYNDKPFHVLTYGTIIPSVLNDVEVNRFLQHQVAVSLSEWQGNGVAKIEEDYVQAIREGVSQVIGDNINPERWMPTRSRILQIFEPMAKLGFYSYDCVQELEKGRGLYRLVAYPDEDISEKRYIIMPEFEGIEVVEEDKERGIILQFKM